PLEVCRLCQAGWRIVARGGRKSAEKDASRHVTAAHSLMLVGKTAHGADFARRRGTGFQRKMPMPRTERLVPCRGEAGALEKRKSEGQNRPPVEWRGACVVARALATISNVQDAIELP